VQEDSGSAADNSHLRFVDIAVGDAADIEKVDLIVPAVQLQVGVPQVITVDSVLRNNGPFSPVDVIDHLTASAPPDCTVTPAGYDTPTSLPLSSDVTLNNTFTLECTTPSFHTFAFANQVDIVSAAVSDPSPTNNSKSADATLAVIADVDLQVETATVTAPSSQAANTPFDVTVSASLHNNGPYSPADADATFDLSLPADCSKSPDNPQTETNVNLEFSISTVVQKVWQITCTQPSFHQYSGTVSVVPTDQHILDPTAANDSGNGLFDGSITIEADVDISLRHQLQPR
jgi:hypothetical protein